MDAKDPAQSVTFPTNGPRLLVTMTDRQKCLLFRQLLQLTKYHTKSRRTWHFGNDKNNIKFFYKLNK